MLKTADHFAALWFAAVSGVTLLTFAADKWRASRSGWRVSENFLVLLGALGGWPGGLLGMAVLRHKTAKWTFQLKYALAVIPFAAEVWAWIHWR